MCFEEYLYRKFLSPNSFLYKLYKVTCWIYLHVLFYQRAFSILRVWILSGKHRFVNRSCDASSGNPSIESPRKHCVAIKLTLRGSASGMRTHHHRPVGLSGPVFAPRSIGAANRWWSLRVFSRNPARRSPSPYLLHIARCIRMSSL